MARKNKYKQQQKGITKQNRTRNYCTNSRASRWRRTLDWRRSARRQALSSASGPFFEPRCHMPTSFAAGFQSRPYLTTTPNATYLSAGSPRRPRYFSGGSLPATSAGHLLAWALSLPTVGTDFALRALICLAEQGPRQTQVGASMLSLLEG